MGGMAARRTVKSDVLWLRRFLRFHHLRHPRTMGKVVVEVFLTCLAVEREVSAWHESTQTPKRSGPGSG